MLVSGLLTLTFLKIRPVISLYVDLEGQTLVAVPWDTIPDACTVLKQNHNTLTDVTNVPSNLTVENLQLNNNLIETFPNDVSKLGSTLQILDLASNRLTSVNIPAGFTKLYLLRLQDNKIDSFPDLGEIKTTLDILHLQKNYIQYIRPAKLLNQLQILRNLFLNDNPLISIPDFTNLQKLSNLRIFNTLLVSLPNLCFLDPMERDNQELNLVDANVHYICDDKMIWLYEAVNAGLVNGQYPTCYNPKSASYVSLENLTITEVINNVVPDDNQLYTELKAPGNFFCHPQVMTIQQGVTATRCALNCLQHPSCLMFSTDGGNCVLTEYDGQTSSSFSSQMHRKWMMVN